jgi:hypothetical protein
LRSTESSLCAAVSGFSVAKGPGTGSSIASDIRKHTRFWPEANRRPTRRFLCPTSSHASDPGTSRLLIFREPTTKRVPVSSSHVANPVPVPAFFFVADRHLSREPRPTRPGSFGPTWRTASCPRRRRPERRFSSTREAQKSLSLPCKEQKASGTFIFRNTQSGSATLPSTCVLKILFTKTATRSKKKDTKVDSLRSAVPSSKLSTSPVLPLNHHQRFLRLSTLPNVPRRHQMTLAPHPAAQTGSSPQSRCPAAPSPRFLPRLRHPRPRLRPPLQPPISSGDTLDGGPLPSPRFLAAG